MTSLGSVSVCMAAYNGAEHIAEQIASILAELGPEDELVIVDDASQDNTVECVRAVDDPRVRLVEGAENHGYARRFEESIGMAAGDHIFLSDQDDVWPAGRVAVMQQALLTHHVVAGNLTRLGGGGSVRPPGALGRWRLTAAQQRHPMRMILRLAGSQAPYYGSAMAIHRDVLATALPLPESARELHDGWLALIGLMSHSMAHVEQVVVHRRIHAGNTSGSLRSLAKIARGRVMFVQMVAEARRRTRHTSR
jgi:glycosyltransferase involved in cell wall biosynthesis